MASEAPEKKRRPSAGKKKKKGADGEESKTLKRPRQAEKDIALPLQEEARQDLGLTEGNKRPCKAQSSIPIAGADPAGQADWLWSRCQADTGASPLERDGLTRDCFIAVPERPQLEDSLRALPDQDCLHGPGQQRLSPGAPAALVITSGAVRAVHLIRQCPSYQQVGLCV